MKDGVKDGVSDTFSFQQSPVDTSFASVFYFGSQSCFSCYKNSKMDKSGVILCRQGSLEP